MGIRVHKVMGYGLTDVTGPDDRRFTKNIYDLLEELDEASLDETLCRVAKVESGIFKGYGSTFWYQRSWWKEGVHKTTDFMTYEEEFGLENVLVFTPPIFPDWNRFDNTMDWMEETENFKQANRVQVFKRPIYPFDGWMDKRTGFPVRAEFNPLMTFHPGEWEPVHEKLLFEGHNGFKTWGEARENTVPKIPLDIVLMCRAFNVFKSDMTILQLRPMLYTYWG